MKVKQLPRESFLILAILVLSVIVLSTLKFVSMDDESFVRLNKLIQYNMGNAEGVDAELRRSAFS
jgi:hypothetical protein